MVPPTLWFTAYPSEVARSAFHSSVTEEMFIAQALITDRGIADMTGAKINCALEIFSQGQMLVIDVQITVPISRLRMV